ncbi:unnamed protein product [Effrenium voratum]|uniref:Uncharacterized protein n=1 Tax=Effrenium voratum TaxID=2562239 RepID=A0AA36MQ72_9DINO|nr:unnamed protein product [Effrenium voratum]
MDPESGSPGPSLPNNSSPSSGVVQQVLHALLEKLKTLMEALAPNKNSVGVENRFYYDTTEKVWKLQGGETEQERLEAEAIRFHTSRGLSSAYAPATTACDASRGDWGNASLPPPPPSAGPVTASLHGPAGDMSSLAHPVYAPQANLGYGAAAPAAPSAPSAPSAAPSGVAGAPLASPFAAAPLSSPFARPVLASPFAQ